MLCLRAPELELWDDLLPKEAWEPSEELRTVDRYLDDPRFMEPFERRGQQRVGRPTIPMETFLRMMFLKYRHGLGYEPLVELVNDSIKWRRFCRIPMSKRVPHSTTLSKLANRFGAEAIEELNRELVRKFNEDRLVAGRKVRVDTTVTEANIEYPTDADLMEDSVRVLTRTIKTIGKKFSEKVAEGFCDSQRKMKRCLIQIGSFLKRRTEDAKEKVNEITAEAARTAARVIGEAEAVAKRFGGFLGGCSTEIKDSANRLYGTLKYWLRLARRILEQTKLRLRGITSIPDRVVSIYDPDARAIRRGVPGKLVEFGYKIRLDEVEGGVVSGYAVQAGNPSDTTQAIPAVEAHMETFGRAPKEAAFDRGFHSAHNEKTLGVLGVQRVSMPVRGKRSKKRTEHERQTWFRRLQRWRAPQEATISRLKRCCGLRLCRTRGHRNAKIWIGFGILAGNLSRLPRLIASARGSKDG